MRITKTESIRAATADGSSRQKSQGNIAQLRRKLERERENFEKEQERLLEHRLKVSLAWPH